MICMRQAGVMLYVSAAILVSLPHYMFAKESDAIREQLDGQRQIRSDLQQQKAAVEQQREGRRQELARMRGARLAEENAALAETLGTIQAIESRMNELRRQADGAIDDVLKIGLSDFESKTAPAHELPDTFAPTGMGIDPDSEARQRPDVPGDTESWRVQTSGDHEAILRAESPGINLAFINEQLRVYESALLDAKAKHNQAKKSLHSSSRFADMLTAERALASRIEEDNRSIAQFEQHIARADLRVENLDQRLSAAHIQESLDSGKFDDTPHVDTAGGTLDLDGLRWHEPSSGGVADLSLPASTSSLILFGDGVESTRRDERETNMKFISHATELEQAARSGDQTQRDAARVRDAGGRDAQTTVDDATRSAAEAQRKDSWGNVLGEAITEGVEKGGEAFGEALGSAAAEQASRSLFERKADRKKDAPAQAEEPVAASPPPAAAAAPQVASGGSGEAAGTKQPEEKAGQEKDSSEPAEEVEGTADEVAIAAVDAAAPAETAQTETTEPEATAGETRQPATTTQAPARRPRRTEPSETDDRPLVTCPACARTFRGIAGQGVPCPYCVTMNCPRCGYSRTYTKGQEPSSCPSCD